MTDMTVAVLLTVHNRREGTLRCLRGLYAQLPVEGVRMEVWLTDDGCTDGTGEAVAEEFPQVHVVEGDGNLFWNRGMIAAWQAAAAHERYDWYLWLNDDTQLNEGALQRLMALAQMSNGQYILVGSTHAVGKPTSLTYGGLLRSGKRIYPPAGGTHPCDTFNGNIVLIPRSAYEVLGTMDPYFHHGIGDFDYGYRAGKAGIGCLVAPGFYGACNRHERIAVWADPKAPLSARWANFNSTLGAAPREMFHYRCRHFGFLSAASRFVSCHIHVLLPWLWSEKRVNPQAFS